MNNIDAIEQAYRNGYEDGKRDAAKHGHWQKIRLRGFEVWACSECQTLGKPQWKVCPVCTAKMYGEIHDKKSQDE